DAVEDDAKGLLLDVVPDRVALGGLLAARVEDGAGQRFQVLPRPVGQDVLLRALADQVDVLHDASSGHLVPRGGEGRTMEPRRPPAPSCQEAARKYKSTRSAPYSISAPTSACGAKPIIGNLFCSVELLAEVPIAACFGRI